MIINEIQQKQLQAIQENATPEQLIWLSGYFYGIANTTGAGHPELIPPPQPKALPNVTILYASQTGNAAGVAETLYEALVAQNIPATLHNMLDYRIKSLKKESHLLIVASTYGDGEAPDEAQSFYHALMSDKAPSLGHLSYAVFGLGDSSYELFCQTGIDFDQRLEALGATRLLTRIDSDVEFEKVAQKWISDITGVLLQSAGNTGQSTQASKPSTLQNWSESQPFKGELLNSINLTDECSEKNVWHLEISLEDSGIQYQPGDIVALLPENDSKLVAQILQTTGLSAEETVLINEQPYSLEAALTQKLDITSLNQSLVEHYAQLAQFDLHSDEIPVLIKEGDLLDLLQTYPSKLNAQSLVDLLRPLRSRQYSIASSQAIYEDEIHVTVKQVEYESLGRPRKGVCSNWLAQLNEGDTIPLYIKPNKAFKLPADQQAPIIMIGAGTGIAPFRSFLQEREAQGLKGNTWLFFGEQRFYSDFLYQLEWQKYVQDGVLENISLAFSRDQKEKIYVQHRLIEHAKTLLEWLENGAYLYVCGDRNHMAKDVHNALIEIISQYGQKTKEEAETYLQTLITQKRYQRDVY